MHWIRGAVVIYVGKGGELEAVSGAVDSLNQPVSFKDQLDGTIMNLNGLKLGGKTYTY